MKNVRTGMIMIMIVAVAAWVVGVLHIELPSEPLHAQHHQSERVVLCQTACTSPVTELVRAPIGVLRSIFQLEPLALTYLLITSIIILLLSVRKQSIITSSSWRPPDIPLLSGRYQTSL